MARRGSREAHDLLIAAPEPPAAVARRREGLAVAPRRARVTSEMSVDELLRVDPGASIPRVVIHRLQNTIDPHEIDALHEAASDPADVGWALAVRVLGLRGDTSALDVVGRLLARGAAGARRRAALQYVTALPPDVSLPVARAWLWTVDDREHAATAILARYARPGDAAAVRAALAAADTYEVICDLVDALGRCREGGPYPELDEVYECSGYSSARARAVAAMAATDPAFAEKWATEGLWDCEPGVRAIAAISARADRAGVERLRELAADPFEDADVRAAARSRLR